MEVAPSREARGLVLLACAGSTFNNSRIRRCAPTFGLDTGHGTHATRGGGRVEIIPLRLPWIGHRSQAQGEVGVQQPDPLGEAGLLIGWLMIGSIFDVHCDLSM